MRKRSLAGHAAGIAAAAMIVLSAVLLTVQVREGEGGRMETEALLSGGKTEGAEGADVYQKEILGCEAVFLGGCYLMLYASGKAEKTGGKRRRSGDVG